MTSRTDTTPPPPPGPGPGRDGSLPPPPTGSRPRLWARRPTLSAAGWLAATGATMLLVASVIVVASRWDSIPQQARFSGLVAALFAAYFTAEWMRERAPVTATALAALAATITAPVGIAAAATFGQPWPVCVLVGGVAALAATEVQSRRWRLPALTSATVVAFGLAAVGLAALTGIPATVVGALGAVGALLLGATRRSIALAVAVGASPALVLLAEAGVGPGTLERIGVVGDSLVWSAPVSSAIAALVVAVTAQRRHDLRLASVAVAVLATGIVTGLAAGDVSDVVWWCLPGIALLALEALASGPPTSIWRRMAAVVPFVAVPVGAAGFYAPLVAVGHVLADESPGAAWTLPLLLSGAAMLATAAGTTRRIGGGWLLAANLVAAVGWFVGAVAIAGAPLIGVALTAFIGWAAVSALTEWRTWEATTAVLATWGFAAVIAGPTDPEWARVLLVAAFGAALVAVVSSIGRDDRGLRLVAAALATGLTMHLVVTTDRPLVGLFTVAVLVALGVALRPEAALVPVSVAEAAVVLSFFGGDVGWWNVGLLGVLAVAFAGVADRSFSSPWAHLSAGTLATAAALGLVVAGFDPAGVTVLLGVGAIALTGLALLRDEYQPVDTAALVAGGLTLGASLGAEPVFVSLAAAVLGAQGVVFGASWRNTSISAGGGVVLAGATISLWWTTGTNELVIEAIAPYGATGTDIVLGVAGAGLIGLGWLIRRTPARPSSWLAYSPGLGLLASWLLATQLESNTEWATFGALGVGVVATATGGFRRLGAPLAIGTAMIAATLFISAGPRLADAPTWAWISLGGIALLVLAAVVERTERPLLPLGNGDTPSLLESFCEEFE